MQLLQSHEVAVVAMAPTVERELLRSGLDFQLVHHRPTEFSLESARMARVPPEHVAKGVVLGDAVGYVLAVIPADSALDLVQVHLQLGRDLALAQEGEAALLFHDCRFGAFPALGTAYGIETWIDERLVESPDIYFEAGDHELLVRLETQDFLQLLHQVNYGRFAQPGFTVSPRRSRPVHSSRASTWTASRR